MNLIVPSVGKDCRLQSYAAPKLEIINIVGKLNLLETLSIKSSLEDWELGEDSLDLEDGN